MWIIIISLLLIGLALIVLEVIFVPGTTLVGIIGIIFAGTGIIISYRFYGSDVGLYILAGTSVVAALALFYGFRSDAWSKFANKSTMKSRVNEGLNSSLRVGDEGTSISSLKPMGTVQFQAGRFEVKTLGDYVDVGTKVTIVHIQDAQIIVKPLN